MRSLSSASPSVVAMLLQMVFEKVTKAAKLRQGQLTFGQHRSHFGAARFLQSIKRYRHIRQALNLPRIEAWEAVLPLIIALEHAHPQAQQDQGPQLEYPWVEGTPPVVRGPATDLAIVQRLANPKDMALPRLANFANALTANLDRAFAP
jgi:hypothetical protein